jgi:hypothetical protein
VSGLKLLHLIIPLLPRKGFTPQGPLPAFCFLRARGAWYFLFFYTPLAGGLLRGGGRAAPPPPPTPIYAPKGLGKPPCRGSHYPSSGFH